MRLVEVLVDFSFPLLSGEDLSVMPSGNHLLAFEKAEVLLELVPEKGGRGLSEGLWAQKNPTASKLGWLS